MDVGERARNPRLKKASEDADQALTGPGSWMVSLTRMRPLRLKLAQWNPP